MGSIKQKNGWLWEAVKKNLEEYELTYDQIQGKAKELYGKELTKAFPKEGNDYFIYDKEKEKYYATEISLDQQEDCFLLNQIEQTKEGYEVEIVEYIEDYSNYQQENKEIMIRNTKGEEVGRILEKEENAAKELVKNKMDEFTKKKMKFKKEDQSIYVQSVSNQ